MGYRIPFLAIEQRRQVRISIPARDNVELQAIGDIPQVKLHSIVDKVLIHLAEAYHLIWAIKVYGRLRHRERHWSQQGKVQLVSIHRGSEHRWLGRYLNVLYGSHPIIRKEIGYLQFHSYSYG